MAQPNRKLAIAQYIHIFLLVATYVLGIILYTRSSPEDLAHQLVQLALLTASALLAGAILYLMLRSGFQEGEHYKQLIFDNYRRLMTRPIFVWFSIPLLFTCLGLIVYFHLSSRQLSLQNQTGESIFLYQSGLIEPLQTLKKEASIKRRLPIGKIILIGTKSINKDTLFVDTIQNSFWQLNQTVYLTALTPSQPRVTSDSLVKQEIIDSHPHIKRESSTRGLDLLNQRTIQLVGIKATALIPTGYTLSQAGIHTVEIGYTGNLRPAKAENLYYYPGGKVKILVDHLDCYQGGELPYTPTFGNNKEDVEADIESAVLKHIQENLPKIKAKIEACLQASQ